MEFLLKGKLQNERLRMTEELSQIERRHRSRSPETVMCSGGLTPRTEKGH